MLQFDPCGQDDSPFPWDTGWDYDTGDWRLTSDCSDLAFDTELHTAAIIALFTDARADESDLLPFDDEIGRRGWWGDSVDIRDDEFEMNIGSKLWLYYRSVLNDTIAREIRIEAERALDVIVQQGAAARIDVEMEYSKSKNEVSLRVSMYSQSGDLRYDQKFARIWHNG